MTISLVTPSFNQKKFLPRALYSVLAQRGDNFQVEYFVQDGGSDDGSVEILKEFETRFKKKEFPNVVRFEWVSQKDQGQSDALNRGLKKCTGKIVAYLNSDDVYAEGAFVKVANFFQANPQAKIVTGKCRIINEQDFEIRKFVTAYKNFWLKHLNYFWLLAENTVSQPATFWRRELHKELGYFNEKEHLVMDYEWWLRVGAKYPFNFLPEVLAHFRIHTESKGGLRFQEQFQNEYAIAKKYAGLKSSRIPIILHKFNQWKITLIYWLLSQLKK